MGRLRFFMPEHERRKRVVAAKPKARDAPAGGQTWKLDERNP
jgi:hypothetical protein